MVPDRPVVRPPTPTALVARPVPFLRYVDHGAAPSSGLAGKQPPLFPVQPGPQATGGQQQIAGRIVSVPLLSSPPMRIEPRPRATCPPPGGRLPQQHPLSQQPPPVRGAAPVSVSVTPPVDATTRTDEIKAKLRAWHSRVKVGKQPELPSPVPTGNGIGRRPPPSAPAGPPAFGSSFPAPAMPGFVLDAGGSVSSTMTAPIVSNTSALPAALLPSVSSTATPVANKAPVSDANHDTGKKESGDAASTTAGGGPNFSGPLSLSEILRRKKNTQVTTEKKPSVVQSTAVLGLAANSYLGQLRSPRDDSAGGSIKRQMTSAEGHYVSMAAQRPAPPPLPPCGVKVSECLPPVSKSDSPEPPTGGPPLPTVGATLPPVGATLPPGGASLPPGGASLPPGGASLPPGGAPLPPGGASLPPGGAPLPPGGAPLPPGGASLPPGGAPLPPEGASLATGGASLATGGVSLPTGGQSLPTGGGLLDVYHDSTDPPVISACKLNGFPAVNPVSNGGSFVSASAVCAVSTVPPEPTREASSAPSHFNDDISLEPVAPTGAQLRLKPTTGPSTLSPLEVPSPSDASSVIPAEPTSLMESSSVAWTSSGFHVSGAVIGSSVHSITPVSEAGPRDKSSVNRSIMDGNVNIIQPLGRPEVLDLTADESPVSLHTSVAEQTSTTGTASCFPLPSKGKPAVQAPGPPATPSKSALDMVPPCLSAAETSIFDHIPARLSDSTELPPASELHNHYGVRSQAPKRAQSLMGKLLSTDNPRVAKAYNDVMETVAEHCSHDQVQWVHRVMDIPTLPADGAAGDPNCMEDTLSLEQHVMRVRDILATLRRFVENSIPAAVRRTPPGTSGGPTLDQPISAESPAAAPRPMPGTDTRPG